MLKTVEVQVWSDIACPWCYVGKRRLESAIARLPAQLGAEGPRVEVVWRAFELDPAAPRVRDRTISYADRLARKYGMPKAQAEEKIQLLTNLAAAEGLEFHFEKIQPGNTFDAHRVLHLAKERGSQDAVKERLLRGYFTDGEPIGEPVALARLATSAGLSCEEVGAVLAGDTYAREVRADEQTARALGISGVPFFVIGGRYAVSGAQSPEALVEVLTRAVLDEPEAMQGEGAACGPAGCA